MRGNGIDGGIGNSVSLSEYRLARGGTGMIHSEVRALYSYWDRLRGDRPCPDRLEIDPHDIPTDARHIFLLEDMGGGNIRFRLAGSALLDAFGFDLRGMSARSIMEGKARESLVALISETLAEPGVGYARLAAPEGRTAWEVVLLPLRGDQGGVDRLIGCLHPTSGRIPEAGPVPLRFTIESMTIHPVGGAARRPAGETHTAAGLAEDGRPFAPAPRTRLTPIEGGRSDGDGAGGRAKLRIVREED